MLNYCPNPNNAVPIILVDKHIGVDAQKGEGITANKFTSDLLTLKNMGKDSVEVWINSSGGSVIEGMQMYNAMKGSGMNITTKNVGGAMSVASWLLQAGNKRYGTSNSFGFVHKVQGIDGEEAKMFNENIINMLASKATLPKEEIASLMENETMISAADMHKYGLIDEVINFKPFTSIESAMNDGEAFIKRNLNIKKGPNMTKINILLGLQNEASEEAMYSAVQKLVDAKNAADTKISEMTNKFAEFEKTNAELISKVEAAENKLKEADKAAKVMAATNLIKEHQGKRLPAEDAKCAKWIELATNDFEGTKEMIEGLALNVTASTIPSDQTSQRKFDPAIMFPMNSYENQVYQAYKNGKRI